MRDTLRQLALMPTANAACQLTVVANRVGEHREGEIGAQGVRGRDRPADRRPGAVRRALGGGRRPMSAGRSVDRAARWRQRSSRSRSGSRATRPPRRRGALRLLAARQALSMFGRRARARRAGTAPAALPEPTCRHLPRRRRRAGDRSRPPAAPARPTPAGAAGRGAQAARTRASRRHSTTGSTPPPPTKLPREELHRQILELIAEIVVEQRLSLHGREQELLGATHRRQHGRARARSSRCCATRRSPTSW